LLFILHGILKFHLIISATISFASAFVVSFIFHKFWTFRNEDKSKIPIQAATYFSVALVNLALNAKFVFFLVRRLGVFYLYAQMISGTILSIITFLTLHFIVFKNTDEEKCADDLREKTLVLADSSIEAAQKVVGELNVKDINSTVLLYGAESCRAGCPPQKIFYFAKFFYKLYRATKCHKKVYCLDVKSTGLGLAIVKSMRRELEITCPQEELNTLNPKNKTEKYILSKITKNS